MSSDEIVYLCDQCDDIFLTKSAIDEHIKENHEASTEDRHDEAERKHKRKIGPASRIKRLWSSEDEEAEDNDFQQTGTVKLKRKMGPVNRVKRKRSSSISNEIEVEESHVVKMGEIVCSKRDRSSNPEMPQTLKDSGSGILQIDMIKLVKGSIDTEIEKKDNKGEGRESQGKVVGNGGGITLDDSNKVKGERGKDGYSFRSGNDFENTNLTNASNGLKKKFDDARGNPEKIVKTECPEPTDFYANGEGLKIETKATPGNLQGTVQGHDNTSGPECFKCRQVCKDNNNLKNHVLSHYYKVFYDVLPVSKPYACPICNHPSRDRITMVRHYAFKHQKIYELTDVIPENLTGSQKKLSGTKGSAKTSAKKKPGGGIVLDGNINDEDIKVERITDMVVERLKKNNRESDEKARETPEDKDTKHNEETDVDKSRYKEGKGEQHSCGDIRNARKAPMSTMFKISSPYSLSCEPNKIKTDEHRLQEEKKRSRVKNDYDAPDPSMRKVIAFDSVALSQPETCKKDKHRDKEENQNDVGKDSKDVRRSPLFGKKSFVSSSCEQERNENDRQRVKGRNQRGEEKKGTNDPRSQMMKIYGLGSYSSQQESKDREVKYRDRIKTFKDVKRPTPLKENSSDPSYFEPVKPMVGSVGSSSSEGKIVILHDKLVKNNNEEIKCDESVLDQASTSTVGIKRSRKDAFGNTSSIYSDSVLSNFFNPKNPSNEGLSSFKIPKLAPVSLLQEERDEKEIDGTSTAQSSERKHRKSSPSITNQNVMVDGQWVTLGTYLEGLGIFPDMDARKLMKQGGDGEARTDNIGQVRKTHTMDKEELEDIHNNNWDMKKINSDEERLKLSRRCFKNPVPANPRNNLTFHGYRGRGKYSSRISVSSVVIKQGVLEPLPGYKRKNREDEVVKTEEKKIEYESFGCLMKNLYYKKYQGQMKGEKISQKQFQDFQFFMKHVKTGQEETKNFLSFYSNKAVTLVESQVDEVRDIEAIVSSYSRFYGQPDPAKCDRCNTIHLFSQHY